MIQHIKIKAWNAGKAHNAEIGYFGHKLFVYDLIRGSLYTNRGGTLLRLGIDSVERI